MFCKANLNTEEVTGTWSYSGLEWAGREKGGMFHFDLAYGGGKRVLPPSAWGGEHV